MRHLQKAIRSIVGQTAIIALFFLFYHIILKYIMRETGLDLGAVNYAHHFVPLYASPEFSVSFWLLPALIVCIGFLFLCYKFLKLSLLPDNINSRTLITIAIVCFIAINISVALIDGYHEIPTETDTEQILKLYEPYTRSGQEYYADVPFIDEMGLRVFLRDFTNRELFDHLSGHTRTHPPGGVVFLWLVSKIFGYNLVSTSLLSILFTALTVIPFYKLAERLYDKKVALYALLLFLITPNFVMFTTTSMDGPFSVFPILSLYLFYEARKRETDPTIPIDAFRPYSFLTGISLALGMFMTYSTVVIGVFLCVIPLLERKRFVQYLKMLAFAATGFIGFYFILSVLTDFQPFEALWLSIKKDERGMGTGYESINRYLHLSFANLFAFLIGVGIPITTVWLRQMVKSVKDWKQNSVLTENENSEERGSWLLRTEESDTFNIGFLMTLLFFTFSTLFTMEVERIWIFMVPFFVIPVAKYLTERPRSDFFWVSGMLVLQLILMEVLLNTYW
ncbi:glycosyltransferase family 39 protein [Candidatus Poribacteria bacterium]|nr:glycosyltransferase family 39 protein [Candidatus Poribacteria bacterium]